MTDSGWLRSGLLVLVRRFEPTIVERALDHCATQPFLKKEPIIIVTELYVLNQANVYDVHFEDQFINEVILAVFIMGRVLNRNSRIYLLDFVCLTYMQSGKNFQLD